jgi:type VI secretion system protein ImpH
MPQFGWRSNKSVEEWLFEEAYAFDFYQAVRLLELMAPKSVAVGETSEPNREPVRFSARVGFDTPASDVYELLPSDRSKDLPPKMVTNFLGLAGAAGPLPTPFAELVMERLREKDTGLRDFLDIFNHRLISLMYRARKVHRVSLSSRTPDQGPMANYLYSFLGLGHASLRKNKDLPYRALLPYAGLLTQQPRSAVGLERMLSDHFRTTISVKQFSGTWRNISRDQWTYLGRPGFTGQNQALGTAVVGTRVWDKQGRFCIEVGPLSLKHYVQFLPGGNAFQPLREMVRFYAGQEFDFSLRLKIKAQEIPELRPAKPLPRLGRSTWLSGTNAPAQKRAQIKAVEQTPELWLARPAERTLPRLGWTTWLRSRPLEKDSQTEISAEYMANG